MAASKAFAVRHSTYSPLSVINYWFGGNEGMAFDNPLATDILCSKVHGNIKCRIIDQETSMYKKIAERAVVLDGTTVKCYTKGYDDMLMFEGRFTKSMSFKAFKISNKTFRVDDKIVLPIETSAFLILYPPSDTNIDLLISVINARVAVINEDIVNKDTVLTYYYHTGPLVQGESGWESSHPDGGGGGSTYYCWSCCNSDAKKGRGCSSVEVTLEDVLLERVTTQRMIHSGKFPYGISQGEWQDTGVNGGGSVSCSYFTRENFTYDCCNQPAGSPGCQMGGKLLL